MKLYLLAKKIHRYLVIIIVFLTMLMATTGGIMKYSSFFSDFNFIYLGLVRYLHNQMSPFFSVVLFLMGITGLVMYFYPAVIARKRKKQSPEAPKIN